MFTQKSKFFFVPPPNPLLCKEGELMELKIQTCNLGDITGLHKCFNFLNRFRIIVFESELKSVVTAFVHDTGFLDEVCGYDHVNQPLS